MKINRRALAEQAKAVLESNWMGHATKPAPNLYPHQWSWDSAFIAMGYAHYNQERAEQEMRSLFTGQWSNGLRPISYSTARSRTTNPGRSFGEPISLLTLLGIH